MVTGLLSDLLPGKSCVVDKIEIKEPVYRRLLDMGLQQGTRVQCAYIAPSGSPMAFWIKDALIAMRRRDCMLVGVVLGG